MTQSIAHIAELMGAWKAVNQNDLRPELRRGNVIRSIQASLAVEQNTLTLEQVTAVLNGKMVLGRLWQSLILSRWQPILAYLPVETVIKRRQKAYYNQLAGADSSGDCSLFIEFMLTSIEESLNEAISAGKTPVKTTERILILLKDHPSFSMTDLATELGKSKSAVERAIRKLREQGRLQRIGPDKGGQWLVI